jgi:hypothetical protein
MARVESVSDLENLVYLGQDLLRAREGKQTSESAHMSFDE